MMPKLQVTKLAELSELKEAQLRDEAEGWIDRYKPVIGRAVMVPDDGSGPMEGVFFQNKGEGLVSWGDSLSDWIEASSLEEMFRLYVKDFM
jgi:hypothetical protein